MEVATKKVPELRFPEFEGDWLLEKYQNIFKFYSTKSFSRNQLNYVDGKVRYIHYGDIHTEFETLFDISKENVPYLNNEIDISKISNDNYCQIGDIIIADASEDYQDIGKAIEVINLKNEKTIAGLHTFLARPKSKSMAIGFSGFLLKTWFVRKQIMTIAQGTKVLGLSTKRLKNIDLIIPSYAEQQKIADFLSQVDKKIELLSQKEAALREYKKGVMQKLFSQEIRFKIKNAAGELVEPPDWEEKRLGDIAKISTGNSNRSTSNLDSKYTFFDRSVDVRKSDIYLFDSEAIIVAGEGQEFIPKYFKGKFDLHQRTYAIMDFKNDNGKFLYYFIHKKQNYFLSQAVGSTVKSLRMPIFNKMNISLPCIEEQTKIANFLSRIDEKIEAVASASLSHRQWKKGLLQKMFV